MPSSKSITVTLGKQHAILDASLASGGYESASDVLREALCALSREEQTVTRTMQEKIRSSLEDLRSDISSADTFAQVRSLHKVKQS